MKTLSWNCRGLGNQATVRALAKLLEKEQPDVLFLMETKLQSDEMRNLNFRRLHYKGCFSVGCEMTPRSRRGGLSMLWNESTDLHLVSFSLHHILCRVVKSDGAHDWMCSGIHGWPETGERSQTWKLIEALSGSITEPWLCLGDFNEIMWQNEKKGGRKRATLSMGQFRDILYTCSLNDLGFTGSPYTWTNGRKGVDYIAERLDRALATKEWKDRFNNAKVRHLPRYKSDHSPIIVMCDGVDLNSPDHTKPRPFRLEHMWLQHPKFEEVLKSSWANTSMETNFMNKVFTCGAELMQWASSEFGSLRKRKKELFEKLAELQNAYPTDVVIEASKRVELELDDVLQKEETMWFQRSRALWLKDGDKNTSFFHQKASHRKKRNTIKCIENEMGEEKTEFDDVVKVIRDYYIQIFKSESGTDTTTVLDALECKVTPEMNEALTKPYTVEEITTAIKQMHPAKAPGPDGMTPLFYQKFWNICKNDVLHAILEILNFGHSPQPINHTNVVLIPKVKTPKTPKDFRPISLSNVIARILTKTMANRLKFLLPTIISDSQSAFVSGRLITDNAMTAFEVFHFMKNKKKGKKGHVALKLDMSKAYDRVEWVFLKKVMMKLGFCSRWINLVMSCVETVSYSIMVNGMPTENFSPERGLRQGDPLSPFLFLFCAEAFSALLRQAETQGRIHGVKITSNAPAISHLFFADDTILFFRATREETDEIKKILQQYESASGQRINFDKTEITASANVSDEKKRELGDQMGVKTVASHSKYLGLPTLIGKGKRQVFAEVVERVMRKMKDWKEKSLSQAGREVLIKSVIQAIPTYSMNCFLLPIATCQEIERATARFFWGSTIEDRKCHWAGWDILTTSKANGGIGFRELHFFNLAMLAKNLWNIMQQPDSMIYRLFKAKYFPRHDILTAEVGYNPSYLWKSLLSARSLIQEGEAWRIGDGKRIRIADDRWIGTVNPRRPANLLHDGIQNEYVESLIDENEHRWKYDLINNTFCQEDAQQIISTPLSFTTLGDKRMWRFTKNGRFTVRSAYHIAVAKFSTIHEKRASSSTPLADWKKMWELKVIPRVKMFLWRACTNSLPTKDNLRKRGVDIDPICGLCGEEVETVNHLLLNCRAASHIWYLGALRIDSNSLPHREFRELIWSKLTTPHEDYTSLLAFTAWEIWNSRNKLYFDKKPLLIQNVVERAHKGWVAYIHTLHCTHPTKEVQRLDVKWKNPSAGNFKLNCDVAILANYQIGLGFVVRDEYGTVTLAGKHMERAQGSSTLLEGISMRWALQMVRRYHVPVDCVESDSKNLVDALNGKSLPDLCCEGTIMDIRSLAAAVGCRNFNFIPRQGNQTAHHAARGPEFLSIAHTPAHLLQWLQNDVID